MGFHDYKSNGKCDVCNKTGEIVVCSSSMGAVSYAYCEDCYDKALEPYGHMVSYIACAGHFPKDINQSYQELCRHILNEFNISEEQFIEDVDKAIIEMDDFFHNYKFEDNDEDYKLDILNESILSIDMSKLDEWKDIFDIKDK